MNFLHMPIGPGIYCIAVDGAGEYIGSATGLLSRASVHSRQLSRGDHPNRKLQDAFDSRNGQAFTIEVVEECPQTILRQRERYWIRRRDPFFNRAEVPRYSKPKQKMPKPPARLSVGTMRRLEKRAAAEQITPDGLVNTLLDQSSGRTLNQVEEAAELTA
jgi:hypothetical protein